jgi:mRNA interferase RelE/StbE
LGDRRFEVRLIATARRSLDRLPADARRRVVRALRGLEIDPRPSGATRLVGQDHEPIWRIRVGDYRVLYELRDEALVVLVIRIGHRREVYRER